jgi:hypothetical protein
LTEVVFHPRLELSVFLTGETIMQLKPKWADKQTDDVALRLAPVVAVLAALMAFVTG